MDTEKRKKIINVVKNVWLVIATFLSIGFIVLMGVACSQVGKQASNNNVNSNVNVVNQVQPKLVSYDDTNFEIALNQNELSYTFENLAIYLRDNGNDLLQNVTLSFNHTDYILSDVSDGEIYFDKTIDNVTYQVFLIYDSVFVNEQNDSNVDNYKFYDAMNELITLDTDSSFFIQCEDSVSYAPIKNAIELDIQANTRTIIGNGGIFENLSNSVVGFIGSLSSGITAMVGVFYNNGALTVVGLLSVIVVAVSLAYFLFRLIIGIIRMRG